MSKFKKKYLNFKDSRALGTGAVVTAQTQSDCIMRCIMSQVCLIIFNLIKI